MVRNGPAQVSSCKLNLNLQISDGSIVNVHQLRCVMRQNERTSCLAARHACKQGLRTGRQASPRERVISLAVKEAAFLPGADGKQTCQQRAGCRRDAPTATRHQPVLHRQCELKKLPRRQHGSRWSGCRVVHQGCRWQALAFSSSSRLTVAPHRLASHSTAVERPSS